VPALPLAIAVRLISAESERRRDIGSAAIGVDSLDDSIVPARDGLLHFSLMGRR